MVKSPKARSPTVPPLFELPPTEEQLGTRAFVEGIFQASRERFGAKRQTGAWVMRGVDAELYTLRDLQVRVVE